jgi:hypothetical protein
MGGTFGAAPANPENSIPKVAGRVLGRAGGVLKEVNRKPKGLSRYRTGNPSL